MFERFFRYITSWNIRFNCRLLKEPKLLAQIEEERKQAAEDLDFERAMILRDQLRELERQAKS